MDSGFGCIIPCHPSPPPLCYFLDYIVGNMGVVLLGDDAVCRIVKKGTVALRLPNGNEWILKEVRHIPDLRKNLISMG